MSPLLVIFAAAFGAATAAFLPRLAHRLAVGFTDDPRSGCAVCSRPFRRGLAGWVRAGSACSCSSGYAVTVLAGAAVSALLTARLGSSPILPPLLLAAVPGLLLAMIDLRCLRLPDRLVGALALLAGVPLALLRPERLLTALAAAGLVLTAYGSVVLISRGGLGLGDVKLGAVVALIAGFHGWPAVLVCLLAAHLINGSVALVLLTRIGRKAAIPFGPALLAGALIAVTTA